MGHQSDKIVASAVRIVSPRQIGFTVIELLVVIGIIAILVGLLFPIVRGVRYAAYAASTQNEISVISNAINQYYTTFNAYPGPLSDDQLCNPGAVTTYGLSIRPTEINPPYYNTSNPATFISGSENLVLGLLGGLARDTSGDGYLLWFNKAAVGQGSMNLNQNAPQRFEAFLQPPTSWLSSSLNPLNLNPQGNGEFLDQAGRWCGDTNIPKFVDQFPDPLPIIYVRARRGAQRILDSTSNPDPNQNQQTLPQYNIDQVWRITLPNDPQGVFPPNGQCVGLPWTGNPASSQWHGLRRIGSPYMTGVTTYNVDGYNSNSAWDGLAYFTNPGTGTAHCPDMFVLIAAGKNRTYGSADDITNFGSTR